jgi:hypothetical protein
MAYAKQGIEKGIPALVCVRTDKKLIIKGKRYTLLKMFYDTKGEYMPIVKKHP